MRLQLPVLATAGLIASTSALSAQDIPGDLPVASLLASAQSHLAKGQAADALLYYDAAIAKDPKNYLSLFKRATAYLSIGRPGQATDDFNKVLDLKPGFEGAHVQLAKIKLKTADWQGARHEYSAARKELDSAEMIELEHAANAAAEAKEAELEKHWEACVSRVGDAILVAPRSAELRERRSRCRFERGEIEEGVSDLHHLVHLRPGDVTPHVIISATNFYGLADLDNGLSQIRKCLHSDPDSKICKALHKQEKSFQKKFVRAQNQLNKGQSTTAGRSLVGTAEEPGLLPVAKDNMERLILDGMIPAKVEARLHSILTEMACQAYIEVSCFFL